MIVVNYAQLSGECREKEMMSEVDDNQEEKEKRYVTRETNKGVKPF